jgi:hypothetical protein
VIGLVAEIGEHNQLNACCAKLAQKGNKKAAIPLLRLLSHAVLHNGDHDDSEYVWLQQQPAVWQADINLKWLSKQFHIQHQSVLNQLLRKFSVVNQNSYSHLNTAKMNNKHNLKHVEHSAVAFFHDVFQPQQTLICISKNIISSVTNTLKQYSNRQKMLQKSFSKPLLFNLNSAFENVFNAFFSNKYNVKLSHDMLSQLGELVQQPLPVNDSSSQLWLSQTWLTQPKLNQSSLVKAEEETFNVVENFFFQH